MSLDDVDKPLIGRASYWYKEVVPRLTESPDEGWLRREEVRKRLNLTTCELAHMREAGKLQFKKQGNAYLFRAPASERIAGFVEVGHAGRPIELESSNRMFPMI